MLKNIVYTLTKLREYPSSFSRCHHLKDLRRFLTISFNTGNSKKVQTCYKYNLYSNETQIILFLAAII